jgi:hypothetical protein
LAVSSSDNIYLAYNKPQDVAFSVVLIHRVIQEELPPLMELISDYILSKKCHINLGPILNIYRVTFIFRFLLNLNFNVNYKLHYQNAFLVTKLNFMLT